MSILRQIERNDRRVDAVLGSFRAKLESVVTKAQVSLSQHLRDKLIFDLSDRVKPTASNIRVVDSMPRIFQQILSEAGYDPLVASFIRQFDGQISFFEEVLREITKGFKVTSSFNQRDFDLFNSLKNGVEGSFGDLVLKAGMVAKTQAMFSVGGMAHRDLTLMLSERLRISIGESSSLASTSISTFYRTIADKGYKKIEDDLAETGDEIRYTYVGPPASDKLIRPFCARLMAQAAAGKTWSRAEIEAMNNGQLANVFRTGGGHNCRHQWVVAIEGDTV